MVMIGQPASILRKNRSIRIQRSSAGLDLDGIRKIANEEGYEEININETSKVISFKKCSGDTTNNIVRINVYWTTGTVGTCLDHPRQGKTQLFRRKVDLPTLRLIFQNPRVHTGYGYHRTSAASIPLQNEATIGRKRGRHDEAEDEEAAAKVQMKWLEEEIELMQKQKTQVQAILDDFAEKRRLKEAAEKAERERKEKLRLEALEREEAERKRKEKLKQEQLRREAEERKRLKIESERYDRGKNIYYMAFEGDHVDQCFGETVISLACGGRTTIFLYENGGWAWSSGLTKYLHNKLNGRNRSLPSPLYVAMGSQDRYYIRFADGKSEWVGCDTMTDELEHTKRAIKTVAFGEHWDSYFIVYEDGGWSYLNIPQNLIDLLQRRQERCDLTCVSLGPDGEYFISARNGRAWWGGMTTSNMNTISKFKDRIKFMDFGDDDTYVIRYN